MKMFRTVTLLALTSAGTAAASEPRTTADLGGGLSVEAETLTRDHGEFCYLHLTAPRLTGTDAENPERAESLRALLEAARDFDAAVSDYEEHNSQPDACTSWWSAHTLETGYDIRFAEHGYLSMVLSTDFYGGGAHGLYGTTSLSINTATAEQVQLSDIVVETALGELIEAFIPKLIAYWDDPATPENEGSEYFAEDWYRSWASELRSVDDIRNFTFDTTGLTVRWNPYEINAYAAGAPEVSFTWEEIEASGWNFPGSVGDTLVAE